MQVRAVCEKVILWAVVEVLFYHGSRYVELRNAVDIPTCALHRRTEKGRWWFGDDTMCAVERVEVVDRGYCMSMIIIRPG